MKMGTRTWWYQVGWTMVKSVRVIPTQRFIMVLATAVLVRLHRVVWVERNLRKLDPSRL